MNLRKLAVSIVLIILACNRISCAYAGELRSLVVDSCPNAPTEPPGGHPAFPTVAAILLPQIFAAGVDMAAAALNEAAKARTIALTAESNVYASYALDKEAQLTISKASKCLIIYLPASKASTVRASTGSVPEWFTRAQARLDDLLDRPELYAEIELKELSPGSLIVRLRPHILAITRQLDASFWRKRQRGYVLAISFKDAASQLAYGAATFSFEDMGVGAWTRDGRNDTDPTVWPQDTNVPKMPMTDEIAQAVNKQKAISIPYITANSFLRERHRKASGISPDNPPDIAFEPEYVTSLQQMCKVLATAKESKDPTKVSDERCPAEVSLARRDFARKVDELTLRAGAIWADQFFKQNCVAKKISKDNLDLCDLPTPKDMIGSTQLAVTVTETADANAFIRTLSTAFNNKKAEIAAALDDKYNPARREELESAAAADDRAARNALRIALLTVQQAEHQLLEASAEPESFRTTIKVQLAQAKIEANKAAAKAAAASPYPDFN